MIPCQLQKCVKLFQEAKTQYESLDIDCLNLIKAKLSVSLPNVEVIVFCTELKGKRRDNQIENLGNIIGKDFGI